MSVQGFSPVLAAQATPQTKPLGENEPTPDPLSSYNRGAYRFNKQLDNILIKPLAEIYINLTPEIIRTGITNFFSNLNDIPVIINGVLQGKGGQATQDTGRLLLNTTVGIGGLFDPATSIGLEKHEEDFGLTLAHWGWEDSSYFVIPVLGPSTIRDAIAFIPNYFMTVWPYVYFAYPHGYSYAGESLAYLNVRANFLKSDPALDTASIDPYVTLRDVYLQKRAAEIRNEFGMDADDTHGGTSSQGGEDLYVE
jgi:phospholipid-binding lipoprotein MlaA